MFANALKRSIPTQLPSLINKAAYDQAILQCREQIESRGLCEIPNFISQSSVNRLLQAGNRLRTSIGGFRSFQNHNVYLDDMTAARDTSTAVQNAAWKSTLACINQKELEEYRGSDRQITRQLLELYNSQALANLMKQAFDLDELYPSADPVGGVYMNFYEKGDQAGWHFDRSIYSINLILKECNFNMQAEQAETDSIRRPGAFMYYPDSRGFLDNNPDFDVANLGMTGSLKGSLHPSLKPLVVPNLKPGTLYLFAGNRSLHSVSENTCGDEEGEEEIVRTNVIFTFNTEPGIVMPEDTRLKFFGV